MAAAILGFFWSAYFFRAASVRGFSRSDWSADGVSDLEGKAGKLIADSSEVNRGQPIACDLVLARGRSGVHAESSSVAAVSIYKGRCRFITVFQAKCAQSLRVGIRIWINRTKIRGAKEAFSLFF
jgi:hypothetical protein